MQHRHLQTSRLRWFVAESGDGPPVVLLHGFPDGWYSWRSQLPALAAAGWQAIAPDMPGYGETDKPAGVARYRTPALVTDIVELIAQYGGEVCLVGHDWGGILAWLVAAQHPHCVRKLVVINAPHPAHFARFLRRHPTQWFRSSYALFFQLPWLPERVLAAGNYRLVRRAWRQERGSEAAFPPEVIAALVAPLKRHGLHAPLNYYRAALRWPADLSGVTARVTAPTLLLWGEEDPFLDTGLTVGLEAWVENLQIVRLRGVGHWAQNIASSEVNEQIARFLRTS